MEAEAETAVAVGEAGCCARSATTDAVAMNATAIDPIIALTRRCFIQPPAPMLNQLCIDLVDHAGARPVNAETPMFSGKKCLKMSQDSDRI